MLTGHHCMCLTGQLGVSVSTFLRKHLIYTIDGENATSISLAGSLAASGVNSSIEI